jgi:hypothetical protein
MLEQIRTKLYKKMLALQELADGHKGKVEENEAGLKRIRSKARQEREYNRNVLPHEELQDSYADAARQIKELLDGPEELELDLADEEYAYEMTPPSDPSPPVERIG